MCDQQNLIFRQLFESESCTYTYLLGCPKTKKAVIIDPVLETVERDAKLIKELGLDLVYGLNTHVHADHVTGTGQLKKHFPQMKSVLSAACGDAHADLHVQNNDLLVFGEENLQVRSTPGHTNGFLSAACGDALADLHVQNNDLIVFGEENLQVRSTPGHTNGCLSYVHHGSRKVFTGDALLIRGCGRTDFQEGCAKKLYNSIHSQIFTLPDDYLIYPGHDYTGRTVTSVAEEKKYNPRLTMNEENFTDFMKNLKLNYPKQIERSIPANKLCGIFENMDEKLKHIVGVNFHVEHNNVYHCQQNSSLN
uniref:Metallo-beta-lactamase domain-containing protein n=1 Tax=Panagrolaimus sp. JU765 TaxID=591449 RepID=A0AC34PZ45_9BILA